MKKLWAPHFEREALQRQLAAEETHPPSLEVDMRSEFFWTLDRISPKRTGGAANGPRINQEELPVLKLRCNSPIPAPDYFGYAGLVFVSAKFRRAMQIWEGDVQYHPVELVEGSASAEAAQYKICRVVRSTEAVDVAASNVELVNRYRGGPPMITTRLKLVIKDKVYSGIFTDPHLPSTLLAADAAAAMSRAQLSGLAIHALAGAQDPGGVSNPFPTDEAEVAALLAET